MHPITPPPKEFVPNLPILEKATDAYKLWHAVLQRFPKTSRYSLGTKIDALFADVLELLLLAGYAPREQKAGLVFRASSKLDVLKCFLKIAWDIKCLDNAAFARLSVPLVEVGRMLGGWRKMLENNAPPTDAGGARR